MKTTETLFLLAASLSLAPIHGFTATRYVNVNNTNPASPYTTWAGAARTIQAAIDAAAPGDEIVVTNGVYQSGGRVVVGAMINRVAVTRPLTVRSVNGPEATVIQGYQVPGTTNGDGAVRCVYLTNGSTLMGFTLTNGATRRSSSDVRETTGGGVWCESTNAVVSNCTLTGNSAGSGGGAYSGTLNNCALAGNSASGSGGGAAHSTLNGCTLTGNSANSGGGVNYGTLNNCALTGNLATGGGGGASYSTLIHCALTRNSAGYGGGAYNGTLEDCALTGNSASLSGYYSNGGGAADCRLNNCALTGNSAKDGGGAAGGMLNNCTLTGNSAQRSGGGASGSVLNNCIAYYNTAALGFGPNYFGGTLNYCCTTPLATNGVGNIATEPQLASASHLSAGSPCRAAGSAAYSIGADIDGEPWANPPSIGCDEHQTGAVTGLLTVAISARYTNAAPGVTLDFVAQIDGRVSASRWEYDDGTVVSNQPYSSHAWPALGDHPVVLRAFNETYPQGVSATVIVQVVEQPVHYVALNNSSPLAPYLSWATAATNIQDALDAATVPGALVLVSNGVYLAGVGVPALVTVRSVNGPKTTVIDRRHAGRGVYLAAGAALAGFTLTNGFAIEGGGVWCESPSAVVSNCTVAGNSAYEGGGVYGGTVNDCALTDNWATDFGGGAAYCTLNNCTLTGNATGDEAEGGGVARCTVNNCTLTGNSSRESGGGAYDSTLNNCVLTTNTAAIYGGAAAYCTLNNCTLTGNFAGYAGGGVFSGDLNNCISYYNRLTYDTNTAAVGANYAPAPWSGVSPNINYCSTTPLPTNGTGNITNEPVFLDPVAGNLRLAWNSPCINAGDNGFAPGGFDLDGHPRIVGGIVDIGAYEFQEPFILGVTVTEGNAGTANAVFSVTLATNHSEVVSVDFVTVDGSARAGCDYLATSGTLVFQPGETLQTIVVAVLGDILDETSELFFVRLSNPTNISLVVTQATGNILDDDTVPLSITGVTVLEGNIGTTNAVFALHLAQPHVLPVSVDFATADGSAVAGADYVATSGMVTFAPGETNKTLTIMVSGDVVDETNETFFVILSNPLHAVLTSAQAIGTILDDDTVPLSITGVTVLEGNAGTTNAVFALHLARPHVLPVSVDFATADGSAVTGADYVATSGTVTFAPGEIDKPVTVLVNGDFLHEADETFFVSLSSPVHASLGNDQAIGRIFNDDTSQAYVDLNSSNPVPPYVDWDTAATTIQDAVDAAMDGDEIVVANGVYATGGRAVFGTMTNRVAVTKRVTVRSLNGFYETTITGRQLPGTRNGDGAVRCVYLSEGAALTGFTLSNGATRSSGDYEQERRGGGVWCSPAGAMVFDCLLTGNSAAAGAGAYQGTLTDCILTSNLADGGGGGALFSTLNNCLITGSSGHYGGGAHGGTLNNCKLTGNSAFAFGGGAYGATLNNCLLTGNSQNGSSCDECSNDYGGGGASHSRLNNCTLTGNSAYGYGGGVYQSTLNNCVVYSNTYENYDASTLNYCCTTPLPAGGQGNFTGAPLFVNPAGANFHLQSNSPCINAGNNFNAPAGPDLDGNPRIVGSTVDVGAYEFPSPQSLISYAWLQRFGLPVAPATEDADSDGDLFNNWQEWRAGTNPTNAQSALRLLTPTPLGLDLLVTWESVSGRNYVVERSMNPALGGNFVPLVRNFPGQAGSTTFTDTNAAAGSGQRYFYRVGVE